ncbi:MAG TPA: hypothetical protein VJN50_04975 [Actinomycetota bacterium]|nr:hypothetical protein [Actinomycetota bacterium]
MRAMMVRWVASATVAGTLVVAPQVFADEPVCQGWAWAYEDSVEGESTPQQAIAAVFGQEAADAQQGSDGFYEDGDYEYAVAQVDGGGWILVAAEVCESGAEAALAHPIADWYANKLWPQGNPTNIRWAFTDEVSGAQKRDAIRAGGNDWDEVGGASFKFTQDLPDHADFDFDNIDCVNREPDNTIHWEIISGDAIGVTTWCNSGGYRDGFAIKFDSNFPDWSFGGTPASDEVDLESAAAHEFGHAAAHKVHWDDGGAASLCPDSAAQHTMCSTVYRGTTRFRSLEDHDKHTLDNAY